MFQEAEHELECRIHDLLCGELSPRETRELLARIVREEPARRLMAEMLEDQRLGREAFSLGQADAWIDASLQELQQSLDQDDLAPAEIEAEPPDPSPPTARSRRRGQWFLRWNRPGGWFRVAAAVVVLTCGYLVYSAYWAGQAIQTHQTRSDSDARQLEQLRGQVAELSQRLGVPSIDHSETDTERFREIWNQVTDQRSNTWVLVRNGGGQLGSIEAAQSVAAKDQEGILLVQCRVADAEGRWVYSADLLVPDRPALNVQLPEAGTLADQPVALAIQTTEGEATVGLALGPDGEFPVRISGRTAIDGEGREIGRVRVGEQTLRVCVWTRRMSDSST